MSRPQMLSAALLLAATVGCYNDRPHDYGQERPPVTDLDSRDSGLQSKDVVDSSDQVVRYLLSLPEFNGPTRQTVVVTGVENRTTNPYFNYDIFLQRLRSNIGMYGRDRIFMVENRDRLNALRNRELDRERDDFQQGDGTGNAMSRVQPDWGIYAVFSDLPNRGTTYYLANYTITNLRTGEEIPLKPYEVKVAR